MPPPRDERLPLDVLRRVMPKLEPVPVPHDPTLLEVLVQSFYDAADKDNDGKR